ADTPGARDRPAGGEPPGDPPERGRPERRGVAAAAARLRRAGLPRGGGLHGPGELGHRARRRFGLRVHAAFRRARFVLDGHAVAGPLRAHRHRDGARLGAALPRALPAAGQRRPLGLGGGRHLRHRPRRADRHGHRAATPVRRSLAARRGADRARRPADPLAPEPRGAVAGGADRGNDLPGVRLLRRAARHGAACVGGGVRGLRALGEHRDERDAALHRHRHPRRHGDAAQPLPAHRRGAVPRLRHGFAGQARGDPLRHHRQHGGAVARAAGELRHPHHGRGGVPRRRPDGGRGDRRRLRVAVAHGRQRRRRDALRRGAARLRPERHRHRHARRAGGDGGLPQLAPATGVAAAGHAARGDRAGDRGDLALRRERHLAVADPEPSGPVAAIALRGGAADAGRFGPEEVRRADGAALAVGARLGRDGADRDAEPEAVVRVRRGL
ncbi:MAG: Manganese transport protein MntH, partial [uncultured Acetobacteraceae bacterium]